MHASFLDMLHDAGDEHFAIVIADSIDVDFDGVVQESVDQNRIVARDAEHIARLHIGFHRRFIGDHNHAAAAQHIGGAQDDRITDLARSHDGFFRRHGGGVARLLEVELLQQNLETLAVFGKVDGIGGGAEDRHAFLDQRVGELERRLSAELHDHARERAVGLFLADDLQNIFGSQRLEIEAIRSVVVGRDGFGIAVDHDGLDSRDPRARKPHGSSNNRTRCPVRCGWGRRRE